SPAADRVWVLRHGESTANVERLIVSAPGPRALTDVGLTAHGRAQARQAAREGRAQGLGPRTAAVASDTAGALPPAEGLAAGRGAAPPRVDGRLRDRSFGRHDEGPASAYEQIWQVDRDRGTHAGGVEQVAAVAARVRAVLEEADELAREAPVVLVAHGDVLQIALAVGAGRDPHEHREVPHLANAELRPLGEGRGEAEAARLR